MEAEDAAQQLLANFPNNPHQAYTIEHSDTYSCAQSSTECSLKYTTHLGAPTEQWPWTHIKVCCDMDKDKIWGALLLFEGQKLPTTMLNSRGKTLKRFLS